MIVGSSPARPTLKGLLDGFPGRLVVTRGRLAPALPRRVGGISADRHVWRVMDVQREAIRAEGLDPHNPAAVAALELVGLEWAALIRILAIEGRGRRYAHRTV